MLAPQSFLSQTHGVRLDSLSSAKWKIKKDKAKIIITEFETPWVKVSVSKPGAVRGSQDVGIIIERTGKDYPDSLID